MKFTDLNFDCLETVLEYLELIDLLNVANSTKRLNKAAELVFARKYGKKTLKIRVRQISRDRSFEITNIGIDINDSKTALQILRCFGPVIYKIDLFETEFSNLHEMNVKVFTYINKYCADYLDQLEIVQCGTEHGDSLNYFDRSFPKLTTLTCIDLALTENFCLNRLFPKMRCLDIRYLFKYPNSSFYNINTKHFPYLQELYINDNFSSKEMVINSLQLNPQLRKLSIHSLGKYSNFNTDLIRKAVDSLQNVESLDICLKPNIFLDDSDNVIQMKNVKSFNIDLSLRQYNNFRSCLLPFSFENLEKFCIRFPEAEFVNGSFNDQFYSFIDRNSSITNLTIEHIRSFDFVDWSRLAKSLPLLLEIYLIHFCNSPIPADEAIEIIAKFKMLKKFHFRLRDYDNFRKRLGKNWDGIYVPFSGVLKLNRKM